jgi:hypothetical protein
MHHSPSKSSNPGIDANVQTVDFRREQSFGEAHRCALFNPETLMAGIFLFASIAEHGHCPSYPAG